MSEVIYGILLGILQGITEFLPISSSGHLIVFSAFYRGESLPLALNVALHLGTTAAVLVFFWRDWLNIFTSVVQRVTQGRRSFAADTLLPGILLGTIPAGVVGLLWKDEIEQYLHHPVMTAGPLALVGILMWYFDRRSAANRDLHSLSIKDALLIGIAQAIALIPGTSRSGVTIMTGRILGFRRQDAAKFSFLLGTPAMAGAAILEGKHIATAIDQPIFAVGLVVSFISGLFAIKALLSILQRFGFMGFAIYRLALATIILATTLH